MRLRQHSTDTGLDSVRDVVQPIEFATHLLVDDMAPHRERDPWVFPGRVTEDRLWLQIDRDSLRHSRKLESVISSRFLMRPPRTVRSRALLGRDDPEFGSFFLGAVELLASSGDSKRRRMCAKPPAGWTGNRDPCSSGLDSMLPPSFTGRKGHLSRSTGLDEIAMLPATLSGEKRLEKVHQELTAPERSHLAAKSKRRPAWAASRGRLGDAVGTDAARAPAPVEEVGSGALFAELRGLIVAAGPGGGTPEQESRIDECAGELARRASLGLLDADAAGGQAVTIAAGWPSDARVSDRAAEVEAWMRERRGYPLHGLLDALAIEAGRLDDRLVPVLEFWDTCLAEGRLTTAIAMSWAAPALLRATHDESLSAALVDRIERTLHDADVQGSAEQRRALLGAMANAFLANPGRARRLRALAVGHPLGSSVELVRRYLR